MNNTKLKWIFVILGTIVVAIFTLTPNKDTISSKNQCANAHAIANNKPVEIVNDTTRIAQVEYVIERIDQLSDIVGADLSASFGKSNRSFLRGDILPLTGSRVPVLQWIVDIGGSDRKNLRLELQHICQVMVKDEMDGRLVALSPDLTLETLISQLRRVRKLLSEQKARLLASCHNCDKLK